MKVRSLVRWLIRVIFGRPKQDVRNLGIMAWTRSGGGSEAHLSAFLKKLPREIRQETESDVRAVTVSVNRFMSDSSEKDRLHMPVFLPALSVHLKMDFPWISDRAFASLETYCKWMAWHEGL